MLDNLASVSYFLPEFALTAAILALVFIVNLVWLS